MSATRRTPTRRFSGFGRGSTQVRLRVFIVVVAMVISVFGVRLFQIQGLDPKAYAARAKAAGAATVILPATRGQILDRKGVALAESVDGLMLIADPKVTTQYGGMIARILADRLAVDYFDTLAKLTKSGSRFQYIERRVPSTLARAVVAEIQKAVTDRATSSTLKKIPFPGIYTLADPLRAYPAKDVAANLVGFLGNEGKAMAGAELAFDKRLAGKDGVETYEVGGGNRIPLGDNSTVKPRNGQDLRLTIDRDLQWYVQRVVRNAVETSRSDSASAVVMDTQTGEVMALADYPTFDANLPGRAKRGDLGSRALQGVYEPGSVEKVLTVGSLLDQGKVTPGTKIIVPSTLRVTDRVIHDWFPHPTLHLTMAGVIAKSSNIGTALASTQLSNQQLYNQLRKFGLGTRTGVGLNGETNGQLPDWHLWTKVNHATIAFGQGISVNTLQMATAINTIANGGELVTPSLIKGSATTDNGLKVGTDYTTKRRVVSKQAARQMARMMEMVTNPNTGTAPGAQVPGYRVSGKTGTAQRVGAKCGCYDGTFTVSFGGFAPADKPRFTVYIVVQNPRNGGGGGSIGGPAFSKIQSYLLSRYAVPPTGTKPANLPITW
ncbi:MAG: penicillin-binding protein 2 [Actinomycetota bacterium]|nr:penicillin-binding protein 2 [Actinomycetota bacterium]